MDQIESLQVNEHGFLDVTALKLIAVVSMLIDHIGYVFFPSVKLLRIIGRLAMPIYCFCVSEGLIHTRSRKAYLLRVSIFALISELPYDMAFNGRFEFKDQNVMFTFIFAILGIDIGEFILEKNRSSAAQFFALIASLLFAALAQVIHTDYGIFGVVLVYMFYFFRSLPVFRILVSALFVTVTCWGKRELYCLPAFILLMLYNGQRGAGFKYLFYSFYPVHLAVLALLDRFMF